MIHLLPLLAACVLVGHAPDDPDPIAAELEVARAAHDGAIDEARRKLVAEFDRWIKSAREAGQLEALRELTEQKSAFEGSDAPPAASKLQSGKVRYESAVRAARRGLAKALKAAEVAYTKADKLDLARQMQEERQGLEEVIGAATPKKPAAEAPDARLQADSHWKGRASVESRDAQGRPQIESVETEAIVTSRDGDRMTLHHIAKHLDGQVVEQDQEAVLGRIERSGKVARRRFTWGQGPGVREGWVSGNTITSSAVSADGRWRSTGRSRLVEP